jgi:hypothetical protein
MEFKLEGMLWKPVATVTKFDDDGNFRDEITVPGNLIVTAGLAYFTNRIIGGGNAALDSTHVRLGVGDDATAAVVGDTDLSTTTNQYYRVMDSTYPQNAAAVMTFKSTFGSGVGNFAWNCWGLDFVSGGSASSSGTVTSLMNRKVASLGTKSGGDWILTVTVTLS